MKKIFLFLLAVTLFTACEDDDFCTEPTTPNLIIRLLEDDSENITKSRSIEIRSNNQTILETVTTDSISIPINTT